MLALGPDQQLIGDVIQRGDQQLDGARAGEHADRADGCCCGGCVRGKAQRPVHRALEQVLEAGPIQVLVNNAGIHDDAVFPGMSAHQWHRVIDVTLNGFYNVTHPLLMPMIRTRWGRIVNISSVAALTGNRGQVNYAAAKGALNSATRALAIELASRGVTVNAVAPGIIRSEMSEGHFDTATIERLVPMQRAGEAGEVASLVDFLCSDSAAYITGQVVSINGGMI